MYYFISYCIPRSKWLSCILNPITKLKLAPLLAEYLYTHKRLDLTGIGSFLLNAETDAVLENVKAGKPVLIEGASFESNPSVKESAGLIDFIASQTGKIKALASADLESHLEIARQFLNIGKPFLFEGIGSLTKLQAGGYGFTPGAPVSERSAITPQKDKAEDLHPQETSEGFKNIFYAPKKNTNHRKTLFIFLLIAGLALALWGGYTVYKKTTRKKNEVAVEDKQANENSTDTNRQMQFTDSITSNKQDSLVNPPAPAAVTVNPGNYKFIVETAGKERALKRYGLLKGFGLNINMETRDSVTFRLFFVLPAAPADTLRLVDSLRRLYTPPGNRAYIEN